MDDHVRRITTTLIETITESTPPNGFQPFRLERVTQQGREIEASSRKITIRPASMCVWVCVSNDFSFSCEEHVPYLLGSFVSRVLIFTGIALFAANLTRLAKIQPRTVLGVKILALLFWNSGAIHSSARISFRLCRKHLSNTRCRTLRSKECIFGSPKTELTWSWIHDGKAVEQNKSSHCCAVPSRDLPRSVSVDLFSSFTKS